MATIEGCDMTTLPPLEGARAADTPPDGHRAAADLRALLADLGADEYLLHRITRWADLGERGYVYVPPLPVDVVVSLVRRATGGGS